MFDLELKYNDINKDLLFVYTMAKQELEFSGIYKEPEDDLDSAMVYLEQIKNELTDCIEKAKKYDIEKMKRSEGGKKSSLNMTKAERRARALKASHARFN